MSREWLSKKCRPCQGGEKPFSEDQAREWLGRLTSGWKIEGGALAKVFEFKNFYETMAFVNAVAFLAHQENHHPDLKVSYRHCEVRWMTHKIGGLSENDFICAAKTDSLLSKEG